MRNSMFGLKMMVAASVFLMTEKYSYSLTDDFSRPGTTIIGGEEVTDFSDPVYKHTVRLLVKVVVSDDETNPEDLRGFKMSMRCSGSLLSTNKVLTAAHCIPSKMATVHKGENVILDLDPEQADIRVFSYYKVGRDYSGIRATGIKKHPGFDDLWFLKMDKTDIWNPVEPINDIAVLKLEYSVPNDKFPTSVVSNSVSRSGTNLVLAGYGRSESNNPMEAPQLRKVDAPFREYQNNGTDFFAGKGNLENPGEIENPKGGCFGDSGGPAYLVKEDGSHEIAGIIVRGPNADSGGCFAAVTILTDTGSYQDFIKNVTFD